MSEKVQQTETGNALQRFLKRKNIIFSAKRYGIDALGAMAQGLFASLLIGTIIGTLGEHRSWCYFPCLQSGRQPIRWAGRADRLQF